MSSTQFVQMYHPLIPSTATTPAWVALQSVDDHAAHGWLLVDPEATLPDPATPYYTTAAADSRFVQDAQLATKMAGHVGDGSAFDLAQRAASVAAVEDAAAVNPAGAWDFAQAPTVAGVPVGGGGAVASVNGQTGAVVLLADDLADFDTASVAAVEDTAAVSPTGAWDFTQAPTVGGLPIGGGASDTSVAGLIDDTSSATHASLRETFGRVDPSAAPVIRSYVTLSRPADGGTSYSFPNRLRSPEPTRRKCVVRNLGASAVQVAYTSTGSTSFNSPSGAQWTAGVVIQPGQEATFTGTPAIFVRPNTSGQAYTVGVLAETGVF